MLYVVRMPDPGNAEVAHGRACALIDDRRFRDAVEPASEACRLRPDWVDAWWNYSVALKHAHRWTECLAACERAIALGEPHESHAHQDTAWRANRRFGLALRTDQELRRLRRLGLWWRRGIRGVSRVL
jgi:hypothetical protein